MSEAVVIVSATLVGVVVGWAAFALGQTFWLRRELRRRQER